MEAPLRETLSERAEKKAAKEAAQQLERSFGRQEAIRRESTRI